MPPLVIRIHTSVIHLTTSHCTDPVTCSESPGCSPLLPACSLSVVRQPLSLSFAFSLLIEHTNTKINYLCLDKARKQRKVYLGTDYYYWLKKVLRDFSFTWDEKKHESSFVVDCRFFVEQWAWSPSHINLYEKSQAYIGGPTPWAFSVTAPVFPAHICAVDSCLLL